MCSREKKVVSGWWSVVCASKPRITNHESRVRQRGYTLIELLLAVAVGTVILAGAYSSYGVIGRQYSKINAFTDIQERGLPTVRLITRDLRMAGHKELDSQLESAWGRIDDPAVVTDSGVVCCDILQVIYDRDTFTRQRITYYVSGRENPVRNALFMDVETWDGDDWNMDTEAALVVDYVEDFQAEGSDENSDDYPQLMDLVLVLRSREAMEQTFTYTTPSYDPGNSNFTATDNYYRDSFVATVNLRNLREY